MKTMLLLAGLLIPPPDTLETEAGALGVKVEVGEVNVFFGREFSCEYVCGCGGFFWDEDEAEPIIISID